jgi:hypothetical protein
MGISEPSQKAMKRSLLLMTQLAGYNTHEISHDFSFISSFNSLLHCIIIRESANRGSANRKLKFIFFKDFMPENWDGGRQMHMELLAYPTVMFGI